MGEIMKILVLADVHNKIENLSKIIDEVNEEEIDMVLCSGDFIDEYDVPQGFSITNIIDMFIQKIISLGKPTFCVPGNLDPSEIIDVFEDYDVNLQNKKKHVGGFDIIGWGGALTPFNTTFEPTEAETKKSLNQLSSTSSSDLILLLHNPPKNTKLDLVHGEHVGSSAEREFIEKAQPLLTITAHIHESMGTDKIGKTTIFYPGPVYDGCYGLVEIKGKSVVCVKKKAT